MLNRILPLACEGDTWCQVGRPPLQLKALREAGLIVPRTLITNDYAAAVAWARGIGGPVVCKQLSPVALEHDGRVRITYTTSVDLAEAEPAALAATAHCLQEQITGKLFEARVTMVGHNAYGVAIHAQSQAAGLDWRRDYASLHYEPFDPPADVLAGMRAYVDAAGQRLATLGFHPALTAGDGVAGLAQHAPYDRIIATCAVQAVPPAWVAQLRPGGLIVADLRGELASSLVVARDNGQGAVSGRFLTEPGHFMWLRARADNPLRDGGQITTHIDYGDVRTTTTRLDPTVLDDPGFRFLLQFTAPGVGQIWTCTPNGRTLARVRGDGGAWAELDPATGTNSATRTPTGSASPPEQQDSTSGLTHQPIASTDHRTATPPSVTRRRPIQSRSSGQVHRSTCR